MSNIYKSFLDSLRFKTYSCYPFVSLFVPLHHSDPWKPESQRCAHDRKRHRLTCDNQSLVLERAHLNKIRKLYISLEDIVQPGLMKDDVLDDLAELCMDQGADVKVVT
jgi:hypothetical protein